MGNSKVRVTVFSSVREIIQNAVHKTQGNTDIELEYLI